MQISRRDAVLGATAAGVAATLPALASDDTELFDLVAQWEAAQEKAKALFDKASLPDIENRDEAEDRAAAADEPVVALAKRIRKTPPHTLPGLAAKCRVAFRELGIRENRKGGWNDEEWAIWSAYQDAERLAKGGTV